MANICATPQATATGKPNWMADALWKTGCHKVCVPSTPHTTLAMWSMYNNNNNCCNIILRPLTQQSVGNKLFSISFTRALQSFSLHLHILWHPFASFFFSFLHLVHSFAMIFFSIFSLLVVICSAVCVPCWIFCHQIMCIKWLWRVWCASGAALCRNCHWSWWYAGFCCCYWC